MFHQCENCLILQEILIKKILEECNGFSTEYSEEVFNEKSQDIIEWASNLIKRMG